MRLLLMALILGTLTVGSLTGFLFAQSQTVETTAGVDVTVWKHAQTEAVYLSTRPADGDWTTHNVPVDLSRRHPEATHWYVGSAIRVNVPVTVEVEAPPVATAPSPQPQACSAATYVRGAWGNYPGVSARATATWTKPHDRVASPGLAHDHHVALEDAHASGGCHWSAAHKDAFSSDRANLNPTTTSFNASKGSRTPDRLSGIAALIIDTAAERCAYATQHRDVKTDWILTMTPDERATVGAWLAGCGDEAEAEAEPESTPARITHSHCQRYRNDGGCDRRYRPTFCSTHTHATLAGHRNDHC